MTETATGRDWLTMTPAHFDVTKLPRRHRKPDPDALWQVPDLLPQPRPAAMPETGGDDLFSLLEET